MTAAAIALAVLAPAVAAAAQTTWSYRGSDAAVRIVGPDHGELRGPRDTIGGLAPGSYGVHFASDALGKPRSLELVVAPGEHVALAVVPAPPAVAIEVPVDTGAWSAAAATDDAGGFEQLDVDMPASTAHRIAASFGPRSDTGVFGVCVRSGADGCYRGLWDRAQQEVRLERWFAGSRLVLGRSPLRNDDRAHTLALQATGFRIELFADDAPVVQAFDGALVRGVAGVVRAGAAPAIARLCLEPVAAARDSSALVQGEAGARLHVATVVSPGHYHVLELRLDRPHALVPLGPAGLEPCLLQPPVAPVVMVADWRGSLGLGSFGEVPASGAFTSDIVWPRLPALRGQAALVRALLVPADGSVLTAVSPSLPLHL